MDATRSEDDTYYSEVEAADSPTYEDPQDYGNLPVAREAYNNKGYNTANDYDDKDTYYSPVYDEASEYPRGEYFTLEYSKQS